MGRMELPAALEQGGLQRHCSLVQKACGLEVKYRIRKVVYRDTAPLSKKPMAQ